MEPIPDQGDVVEAAYRAANAWIGDHSFRPHHQDDFDAALWEQGHGESRVVERSSAVLLRAEPGFEAYEVALTRGTDQLLGNAFGRARIDPKRYYPPIDERTWAKTARLFVFLGGDEDEASIRQAMGMPGRDGYLAVLAVLSDTDRLLPLKILWRGRQLPKPSRAVRPSQDEIRLVPLDGTDGTDGRPTSDDLVERTRRALSFVQTTRTNPRVPAPLLPPEVLDSIEVVRGEGERISRQSRAVFVRQLLDLDRVGFLEALDRVWPWIQAGPAGWLDNDDEVNDRLWDLLIDMKEEGTDISEKLRLAPWKTALGQPKGLALLVDQENKPLRKDESSQNWSKLDQVTAVRTPAGSFIAIPGIPER